MQILQADPFTLVCSLLDSLDSHLIVATTHSDFMVGSSAHNLFSVCLQFL